MDTNGSEHGDENVDAVGGKKKFSGRAKDEEMKDLIARQWRSHCIDPCIHWVSAYKGEKIVGGAKFWIVMGKRREVEVRRSVLWGWMWHLQREK